MIWKTQLLGETVKKWSDACVKDEHEIFHLENTSKKILAVFSKKSCFHNSIETHN